MSLHTNCDAIVKITKKNPIPKNRDGHQNYTKFPKLEAMISESKANTDDARRRSTLLFSLSIWIVLIDAKEEMNHILFSFLFFKEENIISPEHHISSF